MPTNGDNARIRSFFRSLFGLSPMNDDMSVFMAPPGLLGGPGGPGGVPRNTDMSVSLASVRPMVMPETLI